MSTRPDLGPNIIWEVPTTGFIYNGGDSDKIAWLRDQLAEAGYDTTIYAHLHVHEDGPCLYYTPRDLRWRPMIIGASIV